MISTSRGPLVADIHGSLYLLNNDFETVKSWIAHTSGRVTHMVEQNGILITLGVRMFMLALHLLLTSSSGRVHSAPAAAESVGFAN